MAEIKEETSELISPALTSSPNSTTPDPEANALSEVSKLKRRSTRISDLEDKQENERQQRLLAKKALQLEATPQLPYEDYDTYTKVDVRSSGSWTEPPLAEPTPGVTGLPLSSLPSRKIKKEALWPRNKSQNKNAVKKVANGNSDPVVIKDEIEDDELDSDEELSTSSTEPTKRKYEQNLKTKASEPLTEFSDEREVDHAKFTPVEKKGNEQFTRKKAIKATKESTNGNGSIPSTPTKSGRPQNNSKRKIKKSPKKARSNAFGYGAPDLAGQKRAGAFDFEDTTKDNEDFCSACGGTGIFLCCEACPKSFHFICCDPPLDEDSLPEGNWYCNECLSKRKKLKKYNVGIFSKLLNQCEMRNPRRFQLPRKLREATFENVSTGPMGEYQDASVVKHSRPVRAGKLEESDPLNIYDKDGKPLICYKCGLSGLEKPITKCGYCELSWHLDCLNPPLPAVKTLGTRWKCPNHVQDLVPTPKRRYKKQNFVDVSMSRGFRNDGDVEIISEEEDDLEEEIIELPTPGYLDTYYENGEIHAPVGEELEKIITMNNVTYRIPERGVILDFIDSINIKKLKGTNNESGTSDRKMEFLDSIQVFHEREVIDRSSTFKTLLKVVNREGAKLSEDEELSKEEITDLKYLKKLIDIKGRDSLLSFLQS